MQHFGALRLLTRIVVLAAVLLLSACGGDRAGEPAGEVTAAFNDADITFLHDMMPHHFQATEMAELAGERAAHPELEQLATTINSQQASEIGTMRGLLTQAGVDAGEKPMGGMGRGGTQMQGMMSDQQMSELRGLQGEAFDMRFLQMMTEHHQGAIEMAELVLKDGQNPQVSDLARDIIEAQRAEIEQMRTWWQQWSA